MVKLKTSEGWVCYGQVTDLSNRHLSKNDDMSIIYESDIMKEFVCNLLKQKTRSFIYSEYILDIMYRISDIDIDKICGKNGIPKELYDYMSTENIIIYSIFIEGIVGDYISCINKIQSYSYNKVKSIRETPLTKYVTKKYNIIKSKESNDSLEEEGVCYERDRF